MVNKTILITICAVAALQLSASVPSGRLSVVSPLEAEVADAPKAPENLTIGRTDATGWVELRWDAVTEDMAGNALTSGEVTYTVVEHNGTEWVVIAEGIAGTSYSYKAVNDGQRFVQCGVYAVTDKGVNAAQARMIPVGAPYAGIAESFADARFHYVWGAEHIEYGYIDLFNDTQKPDMKSCDGDNGYMGMYGNDGCGMHFISGLVSLEGMDNPALTFHVNNLLNGDDRDDVFVAVNAIDGTVETGFVTLREGTVEELCGGYSGWNRIIVPLGEYKGKTIQFRLSGVTHSYLYKYFDNITVASHPTTDLMAVSASAPISVGRGQTYAVNVIVKNNGTSPAGDYKVALYLDGEEACVMDCDAELKAGELHAFVFERVMSSVASAPSVHEVKVLVDGDCDESNDTSGEFEVSPMAVPAPSPLSLGGGSCEEGLELVWTAPDLSGDVSAPVTETFESGVPFSSSFGGWVFVDKDKSPAGALAGITLPGITGGVTCGSFWVWDCVGAGADYTFNARSGDKYLFALYRNDDGQADDWAISPLLDGSAQQISFYAASYNASWLENIEVYYSTGSPDPAAFMQRKGVGGIVPGPTGNSRSEFVQGWTRFTADLPEGARRFAIRSCAKGAMMLMLDDVTFLPARGYFSGLVVKGYNLYRDGLRINDGPVTGTSFKDTDAPVDRDCVYHVTAIYEGHGESAPSEPFVTRFSGVRVPEAGTAARTVYYNLQGSVVSGELAPGIYIRKTGTVSDKIVVK